MRIENERRCEDSELELAAIEIDAEVVGHTQQAEILMLDAAQDETLLY